jgi:hypothetical protein
MKPYAKRRHECLARTTVLAGLLDTPNPAQRRESFVMALVCSKYDDL